MSVEVQQKPSWPNKFGTLFGKHKTNGKSVVEKTKDAVFSEGHREEGVTGAGQQEETNPIQHVGGTQIVVNQSQSPPSEQQSLSGTKSPIAHFSSTDLKQQGESSQAASLRRNSDDENQPVDSGEDVEDSNIPPDSIGFYRKDEPYFWLSNSSEHAVYYDGIKYPTAEHLFQATKFLPHRPDLASKIRKISSPNDAIKEARKNMTEVKKGWIGKGGNVASMREVLLLKFTQHSILKRQLLLTGDADLVQTSPVDAFWGNASGPGRNELGKALTRTRETIRIQSGLGIGSGAKTI